jgi:predicted RNA-binding Zn-ribbon protein involved in translation (DUF1610 family)
LRRISRPSRQVLVAYEKLRLPLTLLQKDKEDLEEISSELELADEDVKVPYVCPACLIERLLTTDVFLVTKSATHSTHYRSPRCRSASLHRSTRSTTK